MKNLARPLALATLALAAIAANASNARLTGLSAQNVLRGSLQSLRIAGDGDALLLRSPTNHQACTVFASAGFFRPAVHTMKIKIIGKRPGTGRTFLTMFDYQSGRWQSVGSTYLNRSIFDEVTINVLNNPKRFVSLLGKIQLRILTADARLDLDRVRIQID